MKRARHTFDATAYEERIRGGECFICALVAGRPGPYREHIVYRDDRLIAFLSQPPIQLGSCLVAPLDHRTEVVADFELDNYLALQAFLHRLGLALSEVLPVERLYLMSVGSRAGNAHVHWHVVPLPPGVPFEEQQFHAVMVDRAGYLNLSQNEQARLANQIAQALHGGPERGRQRRSRRPGWVTKWVTTGCDCSGRRWTFVDLSQAQLSRPPALWVDLIRQRSVVQVHLGPPSGTSLPPVQTASVRHVDT